MIPIRDTVRSARFPVITVSLIAANVAVFIFELSLGQKLEDFTTAWGMSPAAIHVDLMRHHYAAAAAPFFSSMFLHGGWIHLLGNMLYLWVFGDNVEDKLGHQRFLFLYIFCGITGGVAHAYMNPGSAIPVIGASGAIAGILGGYLLLFPKARILTLVPIIFFFTFIELPALLFLGVWFLMQFFSGYLSLASDVAVNNGDVAWWAHVGGFATGMLFVYPLRKYR
ncbi:MAG TPA: rhomboid family intramembrane serine protease [Bacteroidota bacterium]|nr:rhomboid family intramembrane serine protease [Bacteroidota bacterium]